MKVLVVVAHPDDEVLGVGGTICKHIAEGDQVEVVIVTEPDNEYTTEYKADKIRAQAKVDKFLGIKHRHNLNLPTVSLNTIPFGKLNNKIGDYVKIVNPEIVYTHFKGDLNLDHRLVYEACLVATRPPKHIKLVCFETISETEWGDQTFKPNYYIDVSEFLWKKVEAFGFYKSEIKALPHPRNSNGINTLAFKRGHESGLNVAEAFRIVRWYD